VLLLLLLLPLFEHEHGRSVERLSACPARNMLMPAAVVIF
jgi:hypothetical protein